MSFSSYANLFRLSDVIGRLATCSTQQALSDYIKYFIRKRNFYNFCWFLWWLFIIFHVSTTHQYGNLIWGSLERVWVFSFLYTLDAGPWFGWSRSMEPSESEMRDWIRIFDKGSRLWTNFELVSRNTTISQRLEEILWLKLLGSFQVDWKHYEYSRNLVAKPASIKHRFERFGLVLNRKLWMFQIQQKGSNINLYN